MMMSSANMIGHSSHVACLNTVSDSWDHHPTIWLRNRIHCSWKASMAKASGSIPKDAETLQSRWAVRGLTRWCTTPPSSSLPSWKAHLRICSIRAHVFWFMYVQASNDHYNNFLSFCTPRFLCIIVSIQPTSFVDLWISWLHRCASIAWKPVDVFFFPRFKWSRVSYMCSCGGYKLHPIMNIAYQQVQHVG